MAIWRRDITITTVEPAPVLPDSPNRASCHAKPCMSVQGVVLMCAPRVESRNTTWASLVLSPLGCHGSERDPGGKQGILEVTPG